jgi:hypothetical protein
VFTAKLPGALNPESYRLVSVLEQDLGPIVEGNVIGANSMIRATLAGVIAGEDESALFAVVPPGVTSVEVSPLSHAVATVFIGAWCDWRSRKSHQ